MRYALIKNGKVENIVVADHDMKEMLERHSDKAIYIDELKPQPNIGWFYKDGRFIEPVIIEEPENES